MPQSDVQLSVTLHVPTSTLHQRSAPQTLVTLRGSTVIFSVISIPATPARSGFATESTRRRGSSTLDLFARRKISPFVTYDQNYFKMLTPSGNQYLRPEYLSPLPTTQSTRGQVHHWHHPVGNSSYLDAKKSPLALLAQTCSNIGADTPGTKSLMAPSDKASKPEADKPSRDKSTPHEDKSSFKPYESIKKEEACSDTEKSGFRTPTSKSCSPAVSSTGSAGSGKASPAAPTDTTAKSADATAVSAANAIAPHAQHNRISIGCGNMFVEVNHHEPSLPKEHLPLGYKSSAQLLPGLPLGPLSNCSGCHVDSSSPSSYPAMPQGGKPGYPPSSALSPYVAYARVKTAQGGTTLVPICRDPYCTNCQLSMQNAQQLAGAPCPSGCTQCNHEKALGVPGMGPMSSLALIPGLGVSSAANPMMNLGAGIYSHSMFTPRPYVCNWIAGDTYCGKRFTTSEELLQHLRTHTSLSASDSAALPLLNSSLSLPSAVSLGACHLHYSMAPSLTSPAGLHRTYPTSLSPVSSLSASRYHPYKSPLQSMPGAPLTPFPPHPGYGPQYFSPYAMYGQRLGAAVHP